MLRNSDDSLRWLCKLCNIIVSALRILYSFFLSFWSSSFLASFLPSSVFLFHFPTKICTLFFAETRNFNAMCRMSPVRIPTFLGRKILLSLLLKISALRNSSLIAPFLTDIEQSRSKMLLRQVHIAFISERELMFMFAICRRPSVCLSSVVCL